MRIIKDLRWEKRELIQDDDGDQFIRTQYKKSGKAVWEGADPKIDLAFEEEELEKQYQRLIKLKKWVTFNAPVKPKGLARPYLTEFGDVAFRAKETRTKQGHPFVSLYLGRKKVWSCNPEFFQTNFYNEEGGK